MENAMKLVCYPAACISMLLFLLPLFADEPQKPNDLKTPSRFSHNLSRHEFPNAGRSSFTLDIQTKQPHVTVVVWCRLQKDKQLVGQFRLERTETKDEDEIRYRVSCLMDEYITDSKLHVAIRDNATGKNIGGITLPLRNAEVVSIR